MGSFSESALTLVARVGAVVGVVIGGIEGFRLMPYRISPRERLNDTLEFAFCGFFLGPFIAIAVVSWIMLFLEAFRPAW